MLRACCVLAASLALAADAAKGADDKSADLFSAMDRAARNAPYRPQPALDVINACQALGKSRVNGSLTREQFERIYQPSFGELPPPPKSEKGKRRRAKRVAIGFFGLTRSLRKTICSLAEMIFRPLLAERIEIDVFVHTYQLDRLHRSTKNRVEGHGAALDVNEWKLLPFVKDVQVDHQHEVENTLDTSRYKPDIEDMPSTCVPSPVLNGKRDECCLPELEFHRFQYCNYLEYTPPRNIMKKLKAKYVSEDEICRDRSFEDAGDDEECCFLRREMKAENGQPSKRTPYGWGHCPKEHEGPLRNVLLQYTSLERLAALIKKSDTTYDIVMYLRPDVAYLTSLDVTEFEILLEFSSRTGKEAAAFPLWGSSGGLNDRFAFGTPGAMEVYATRLEAAARYVRFTNHGLRPELFLFHLMVRRFVPNEEMEVEVGSEEEIATFWSTISFVRVRNACSKIPPQGIPALSEAFAGCYVATQDCTNFPYLMNRDAFDLFLPAQGQHRFDGNLVGAITGQNIPHNVENIPWMGQLLCARSPPSDARARKSMARKVLIQSVTAPTAPLLTSWLDENGIELQELDPSLAFAIPALHGMAKEATKRSKKFHVMEYTRVSGWGLPLCMNAAFDLSMQRECRSREIEQDFSKLQFPILGKQLDSGIARKHFEKGTDIYTKTYMQYCCRDDLYVA